MDSLLMTSMECKLISMLTSTGRYSFPWANCMSLNKTCRECEAIFSGSLEPKVNPPPLFLHVPSQDRRLSGWLILANLIGRPFMM